MTSFRILELVLLVIASSKSIVAVDGDNSGGTHVTIQIQNAAELTFNKPKDFKVDFEEFENKTKSYIQSAKKANEARSSDSLRFLTELNQYIAKLPKGKSTTIKFRGRLACDCDGKRMNPCPAQCMYSCFGLFESGKGWISENDCRNKQFLECQCYRGSLEMCNSGITSCFKETTGELPGDEVCSTYSVDEDKLVQSYVLVEDLLVEPINVFIRKLRSSLGSMGQTAESIEHLSSLKWSACNPNVDQKCSEGPAALLRNQIESYQLLKMNLTSEMIVTLKETININKDVIGLRERIFTHVNGLLKGYACCLRASNHNTEKIDCSPAQQLPSTDWYLLVPNRTEPQKPKELPVYGSYKWVPSNGSSFPENAVRAGTELNETPLYAGRVLIEGMLLPAKVTSKGRCYLPNDGKEFYTESNFQILVSKDVYWEPMNSDMPIPPDALIVGFDKKSDPIYMGRAVLFDHNVPGQVLLVIASSKSIVADGGDNSGGTHVTIQIQNAAELTFNKPKDFKVDFAEFEEKTKSYIKSAKKANEARSSDSLRFLTELNQYIAKLPKGKSTTIKFRGRLACDCDGKRMNPCPAQCLYSCFGLFESGKGWISENDCRNKEFLECQCYRGSLEMCNSGITSCFKETTGELPGDEVCSTYSVDEDKLVQSYFLFEDLRVEPINVFIRKLESSLGSMGQTAESIEHLSSLKWSACNPNVDQKCSEGPAALLRNQIESYQLLKINLASEMIVKLKETRNINNNVIGLRERIFSHVNELLKGYACCLRASNHNTEKIDCSPAQPLPSTDWSLLVPNRTEPQKPKEPVYGSYKWVASKGKSIPENAVRAGTEQNESPFYAGRALFEGMLLPAKVTAYGTCFVSNDGKEHFLQSNFEILVSKDVYWEPMNSNMPIPPDALKVGFDKKGDPLYMGRTVIYNRNVPGQVKTSDRCAYVPFGYEERKSCNYEILVLKKIK